MLLQMATFHSFEWLSSIPFFFPDSSVGKESACNVGDLGSISGLGRSPGEGKGYPLQYSGLENPMGCIDLSRVGQDQAIHILIRKTTSPEYSGSQRNTIMNHF